MSPNKGLFSVNYRRSQAKSEINYYEKKINWKTICTSNYKGPLPLILKQSLQTTRKRLSKKKNTHNI